MRLSLLFVAAGYACPAYRTVMVLRHGFFVISTFLLNKVMELCKAKTHAVKPFLSSLRVQEVSKRHLLMRLTFHPLLAPPFPTSPIVTPIELVRSHFFIRIKLSLRQKTLPVARLFGTHNRQLFLACRPQKNVAGTARTEIRNIPVMCVPLAVC